MEPGTDGTEASSSAGLVAAEVRADGGEAVAHVGSVSSWTDGQRLVDLALESFGRLDVLVNNAGFIRDKLLVNMAEDDWDAVVDVHLKGQFVPLRFAAAHWRDRSKAGETVHASVINTTAGAGLQGNVGQANYGSAKAGAAALTVIAARELQRFGVHVNAVAPLARTRMLESVAALAETIRKPDDPTQFDPFEPDNVTPLAVVPGEHGVRRHWAGVRRVRVEARRAIRGGRRPGGSSSIASGRSTRSPRPWPTFPPIPRPSSAERPYAIAPSGVQPHAARPLTRRNAVFTITVSVGHWPSHPLADRTSPTSSRSRRRRPPAHSDTER